MLWCWLPFPMWLHVACRPKPGKKLILIEKFTIRDNYIGVWDLKSKRKRKIRWRYKSFELKWKNELKIGSTREVWELTKLCLVFFQTISFTSARNCRWKFNSRKERYSISALILKSSDILVGRLVNSSIRWAIREAILQKFQVFIWWKYVESGME